MRSVSVAVLGVLAVCGGAAPAWAQAQPVVGVRAAGMGGAFTGVADDASAVYWNPAGLASGAFFGLTLDRNWVTKPGDGSLPVDRSAFLLAMGTPPFGLTYYRLTTIAVPEPSTTKPQLLPSAVEFTTHHVGATVLHSLRSGLAIGGTAKLVHGETPILDENKFDADLGIMLSGAAGRLGLVARNVTEPTFRAQAGEVRLQRQIRMGMSLHLMQAMTLAFDTDFTKATTLRGQYRDAAIGAESRLLKRVWARGGIHWNTAGGESLGGAAPIGSVGTSVAVYGSVTADAQYSFGSRNGDKSWGVGLRIVF